MFLNVQLLGGFINEWMQLMGRFTVVSEVI